MNKKTPPMMRSPPTSTIGRSRLSADWTPPVAAQPMVLFTFQCHPSVKQPAIPSRRDYTATPLCSPPHIFSTIWGGAPLSCVEGTAEEPSPVLLDYHERGLETVGKSTSIKSGASQVSISKVLAAQKLLWQHKQRARRASCPGSRRIPESSEGTGSQNSCTHQAAALIRANNRAVQEQRQP